MIGGEMHLCVVKETFALFIMMLDAVTVNFKVISAV